MAGKAPKLKVVRYERIDPSSDPDGIHPLIRDLVRAHHDHLAEAKIGCAYRTGLKRDKDGLLVLGKCRKASDLDKQFSDLDFVIILNAEAWKKLTAAQRRALVDHELMHASVTRDADGDIVRDNTGRPVYRCRKHDLEEFRDIVQRHGCYKADIESFVRAVFDAPAGSGPSLLDFVGETAVSPAFGSIGVKCPDCGIVRPESDPVCGVCAKSAAPAETPAAKKRRA